MSLQDSPLRGPPFEEHGLPEVDQRRRYDQKQHDHQRGAGWVAAVVTAIFAAVAAVLSPSTSGVGEHRRDRAHLHAAGVLDAAVGVA
jgi:hypothetical protein